MSPQPKVGSLPLMPRSTAVVDSLLVIWGGVQCGWDCLIVAAAAVTNGAANEVPDLKTPLPFSCGTQMSTPGAEKAIYVPLFACR